MEISFDNGIIHWYSHGLYIHEKGNQLLKNIWINFEGITAWTYEQRNQSYQEDGQQYPYTESIHLICLNNNLIIKLRYEEPSDYIFEKYLELSGQTPVN